MVLNKDDDYKDINWRWYTVIGESCDHDVTTHDGKLIAFIETFKTWYHYLKGCKHEILILTNHNNLRQFMDIKSLSLRQDQ